MQQELVQTHYRQWLDALPTEVHFWDSWFAERGMQWHHNYLCRLTVREVEDPIRALLAMTEGPHRVLDVGSGPMTTIGTLFRGTRIDLQAVDPLADAYAQLIAHHGVRPPVVTRALPGENLSDLFPPESFDVAHAQNALDHAIDPVRIIEHMVEVVKPGGHVVLHHEQNEGVNERYEGLHQWNFERVGRSMHVWDRLGQRVDVGARLAPKASIVRLRVGTTRVIDEVPDSPDAGSISPTMNEDYGPSSLVLIFRKHD